MHPYIKGKKSLNRRHFSHEAFQSGPQNVWNISRYYMQHIPYSEENNTMTILRHSKCLPISMRCMLEILDNIYTELYSRSDLILSSQIRSGLCMSFKKSPDQSSCLNLNLSFDLKLTSDHWGTMKTLDVQIPKARNFQTSADFFGHLWAKVGSNICRK